MEDGNVFGRNASSAASMRLLESLEIVRMDDYLVTGTRKQFWREEFVAAVIKVEELLELQLSSSYT